MKKTRVPRFDARNAGTAKAASSAVSTANAENSAPQTTAGNPPAGGILSGVKACFALRDSLLMLQLHQTFLRLGGIAVSQEDMAQATHLVFEGASADVWHEARELDLICVSPNWLKLCDEAGMRLTEACTPAIAPADVSSAADTSADFASASAAVAPPPPTNSGAASSADAAGAAIEGRPSKGGLSKGGRAGAGGRSLVPKPPRFGQSPLGSSQRFPETSRSLAAVEPPLPQGTQEEEGQDDVEGEAERAGGAARSAAIAEVTEEEDNDDDDDAEVLVEAEEEEEGSDVGAAFSPGLDVTNAKSMVAFLERAGHPVPARQTLALLRRAVDECRAQARHTLPPLQKEPAHRAEMTAAAMAASRLRANRRGGGEEEEEEEEEEAGAEAGAEAAAAETPAPPKAGEGRASRRASTAAATAASRSIAAQQVAAGGGGSGGEGDDCAAGGRAKRRRSGRLSGEVGGNGEGTDRDAEAPAVASGGSRRSRRTSDPPGAGVAAAAAEAAKSGKRGGDGRRGRDAKKRSAAVDDDENEQEEQQEEQEVQEEQQAGGKRGRARRKSSAEAPQSGDGDVKKAPSKKSSASSSANVGARTGGSKRSKGAQGAAAAENMHEAQDEAEMEEEIDWERRHALAPRQLSVSLSSDQTLRETVLGAISGLGGCGLPVCDAPQRPGPQVSHLVVSAAGGSGGGLARLKRTGKLLFAMARGLPVVTADWVLHSVSAGKWLDAAGFVAVPTHPRAQRQLHGKLFYVNSTDTIDKPTLESLIHDAGGSIVPRRSATHVVTASAGGQAGHLAALGAGVGCEEDDWRAPLKIDEKWIFEEVMGTREEAEDDAEPDDDDDEEDSEEF